MFANLNSVVLPSGLTLPMAFPKWAAGPHAFVEFHRYALESSPIRARLHHWIGLLFGYRQTGADAMAALNLFNAFASSRERRSWTRSRGQCPAPLFSAPFPQFRQTATADLEIVRGDGGARAGVVWRRGTFERTE
jgi:hypothetical protein